MKKLKPVPLTVLEATLEAYEQKLESDSRSFTDAATEFRTQWTEYIVMLARKQHKVRLARLVPERQVYVNFGTNYYGNQLSTGVSFHSKEAAKGDHTISTDIKVKVPPRELAKWKARAAEISRLRSQKSPRREFIRGVLHHNPQVAEQIVKLINKAVKAEGEKAPKKKPKC